MSRNIRSVMACCPGVLVSLLLLSGCAGQGSAEAENAEAAAVEFSRAVQSSTAAACRLLAPQTLKAVEDEHGPCTGSLPDEVSASGPAESVDVYGRDAIVRLASDTIFLARFPRGWRVTAAGCTREHDGRPYDCKVRAD